MTPARLSPQALSALPASVRQPAYDRDSVTTGIVHLGVGAFHRAHQAAYVDDILAAGDLRWGIAGISLRSSDVREALAPQGGLYALATRSGEGTALRVIGSLREVLVAPESVEAVLARMCDPAVAIVSLTITEKGYCRDPATGDLDTNHPLIRADLADAARPHSAVGLMIAALARRRAAGVAPFTVLPCDNLPANGRAVHRVLGQFARALSADLGAFVEGEVAVASTMVDRIVPATTDTDRTDIARALGVADAWPVVTEPFSQWVVEDRFSGGRPAFEDVGAEMVGDVTPYEEMKLRLLNGAHSSLAYLGSLAGLETVADAIATPGLRTFTIALMSDAAETLAGVSASNVARYRDALLVRFANPALHHRLRQIAMDGSQKLPQRILAAIRARLSRGLPIERHGLAVAAWIGFVTRRDTGGAIIRVDDPLADAIAAAGAIGDGAAALLALRPAFGDLGADPRFVAAVERQRQAIAAHGALRAAAIAAG